jgi:hypothetical protein
MARTVYVAKKRFEVADGEVQRGDLIPEASDWSNADAWINNGYIEKAVVPDDLDDSDVAHVLGLDPEQPNEDQIRADEFLAAVLVATVSPEVKAALEAPDEAKKREAIEEAERIAAENEKSAAARQIEAETAAAVAEQQGTADNPPQGSDNPDAPQLEPESTERDADDSTPVVVAADEATQPDNE